MRQLTGTEAGTLSGLLSYGTYVLDFGLNGTLCAGIDARQAVQRPFHHVHLHANQLVLGSQLFPHDDVDLSRSSPNF